MAYVEVYYSFETLHTNCICIQLCAFEFSMHGSRAVARTLIGGGGGGGGVYSYIHVLPD